nr:HAD-IA family hydrolase [Maliibacterium massiliense]
MVRFCIFDLDGTLLDTLDDLAACCNAMLQARGLPSHPTDAYRQFVGNGVGNLIKSALPPHMRTDDVLAACRADFGARYGAHCMDSTAPYPGVAAMLDALQKRGVCLAVLSNKPEPFAQRMVEAFFGPDRFAAVFGQRAGLRRKPAPDGALALLARLGKTQRETLLVGDSDVDVYTAQNARLRCAGAGWGFRGSAELWRAGCDALLETPMDLLALLDNGAS